MTRIPSIVPENVNPPQDLSPVATALEASAAARATDLAPNPPTSPARLVAALAAADLARVLAALDQPTEETAEPARDVLRGLLASPAVETALPPSLVRDVRDRLLPAVPLHDAPQLARVLQQIVEHGGTFFEARVAQAFAAAGTLEAEPPALPAVDLRTLLGQLVQASGRPAVHGASAGESSSWSDDAVHAAAAAAGREVLRDQLVAVSAAHADGGWEGAWTLQCGALPVDLRWRLEAEHDREPGRGQGSAGRRLTLVLRAADVPSAEAAFTWAGSSLAVTICVASDATRAAIAAEREALVARLQAAGFASVRVEVRANPARLAALHSVAAAPARAGLSVRA